MTTREVLDLAQPVSLVIFMSATAYGLFAIGKGMRNIAALLFELSKNQRQLLRLLVAREATRIADEAASSPGGEPPN